MTPDQIRQDERYTAAAKEAKRWARAAISAFDKGLPRSATMELETALGMAQQALWVWRELEKQEETE